MQLEKLKVTGKKVETRPTVSSFAFSSLEQYQDDGIFSYESLEIKENFCDAPERESPGDSEVTPAPTLYEPFQAKTIKNATTCGRANGGIHNLSDYEVPRETKIPPQPTYVESSSRPTLKESKPKVSTAVTLPAIQKTENPLKMVVQERIEPKVQERILQGMVTSNQQEKSVRTANIEDKKAKKPTPEAPKFDLVKAVNFIREWFTIGSLFNLIGPEEAYKRLQAKIDALAADSSAPDWEPTIELKLLKLCKEMNNKVDEGNKQPDADKVACSALDLKVAAYFQGKTSYDPSEMLETPILPTVERFEQIKARQKIVLMRLDKV